jgi:MSHA biogenesis protein MshM
MQPLSRNILESYLMFRMRAAGYRGPNIFSPSAVKLIADASNGLMRRVNILADKSLLSAFVEDTYYVKANHVQAALRDSDLEPTRSRKRKGLLLAGITATVLLAGLVAWWAMQQGPESVSRAAQPDVRSPGITGSVGISAKEAGASAVASAQPMTPETANVSVPTDAAAENRAATPAVVPAPVHDKTAPGVEKPVVENKESPAVSPPAIKDYILFEQRMAAGKQLLAQKSAVASIQLFYNEKINPERIEGFLGRADKLGVLHEIYLLPTKFGRNDGLRVLYGAYPSIDAAKKAARELPKRYREAFATSIHLF